MSHKLEIVNLIALLLIIFTTAAVVWYAPVLFKGYVPMELWSTSILARNYSQTGIFGIENNLNVFLSSSLVQGGAEISTDGNKLTPIILAQIFKLTGLPKYENLIFISIAILALVLLFFTVTVYCLFGLKTAGLFAFIYILLPFNWWYGPYNFGVYEIPLLFFSLFFLFFVLGFYSQWKYKYIFLVIAGIFLALAGIAKEAMFIIVPVLFICLLLKRQRQCLFYLLIPFFIIIFSFWLPDIILGKNSHSLFLKNQSLQNTSNFISWDFLCHFYPDPYTFHFAKEGFLNNFNFSSSDLTFLEKMSLIKGASDINLQVPNFVNRLKLGMVLFLRHIFRFLAIEDFGGPLIFLLFIAGFYILRKKDKNLFNLFSIWIIFLILTLSFILSGRSHLIDFGWVIALTSALGLLFLIDILSGYFQLESKGRLIIGILLTLLVLYNLVLSNHVLWGKIYDKTHFLRMSVYGQEINKLNIGEKEVIAVDLEQFQINKLNYLTDKSMVVFAPETIKELIQENKLQDAFDKFGVKYVLGYSPEMTEKIITNAKVKNIVSNDIDLTLPEVSKTKSWLMNLVR